MWSIDTWEKRKSINIQIPAGKAPTGDTRVQFHSDQIRMLVVHETQLAIYDASKMERVRHVRVGYILLTIDCSTRVIKKIVFVFYCSGLHKMDCLHLYLMQHTPVTVSWFMLPLLMVTLESMMRTASG